MYFSFFKGNLLACLGQRFNRSYGSFNRQSFAQTSHCINVVFNLYTYQIIFSRETDETIEHLFWECDHVQSLLQSIDNYCMNILASSFNVQKQDFILGDVKGQNF